MYSVFQSVWFQDAGVATSSPMEPSACVCVYVYFSTRLCVFTFPYTFQLLSPILFVKPKRKNNSNSNNYNDNNKRNGRREVYVFSS